MSHISCQIDPQILFHSYDGLKKKLSEAELDSPVDREAVFELRAGILYIEEDFAETFSSLKTLLPKCQINFSTLWTLYPPNTIVWTTDELGHLRAYKVRECHNTTDEKGIPWLVLETDYIDSNGNDIGWVKGHILQILGFNGVKDLQDLQYLPLEFDIKEDKIRDLLIENGKVAIKKHGRHVVEYEGRALRQGQKGWIKFNVRFSVVIMNIAGLC